MVKQSSGGVDHVGGGVGLVALVLVLLLAVFFGGVGVGVA